MKTLSLIALALFSSTVMAQGVSSTQKTVEVKPFTSIKASGVFTLKLSQGSESVKLEGDEGLISKIKVVNEGNTLVIKMEGEKGEKGKSTAKKGVTITVSFREISSADFNMVGDVTGTGTIKIPALTINNNGVGDFSMSLQTGSLVMKNSGVGEIELKGSADKADITNRGVGEVDAEQFKVKEMQVTNSGVGEVTVNVEKSIRVKNSGMGKVKNVGAAKIASTKSVEI